MQRHPIDLLSLIGGLIVVAVAIAVLAGAPLTFSAELRWLLPALLVVIGVVLVATAGRRGASTARHEATGTSDAVGIPDADPADAPGSDVATAEHDEAPTR